MRSLVSLTTASVGIVASPHSEAPSPSVYLPAAHSEHLLDWGPLKKPTGHTEQAALPGALAKWPAGHSAQGPDVLREKPGRQIWQEAPESPKPAGQPPHLSAPQALNLSHLRQSAAPGLEKVPEGHRRHVSESKVKLNVFAGQGWHVALSTYSPGAHVEAATVEVISAMR